MTIRKKIEKIEASLLHEVNVLESWHMTCIADDEDGKADVFRDLKYRLLAPISILRKDFLEKLEGVSIKQLEHTVCDVHTMLLSVFRSLLALQEAYKLIGDLSMEVGLKKIANQVKESAGDLLDAGSKAIDAVNVANMGASEHAVLIGAVCKVNSKNVSTYDGKFAQLLADRICDIIAEETRPGRFLY
jgi:hypothetical protein